MNRGRKAPVFFRPEKIPCDDWNRVVTGMGELRARIEIPH